MKDIKDIQRIEYVLDNFDSIYKSNQLSQKFKNSDNSFAQKVVLIKRIDGHYVVVEAVPDSKAKKSHIISAYKIKAGEVPYDLLKSLGLTSNNELLPTFDKDLSQVNPQLSKWLGTVNDKSFNKEANSQSDNLLTHVSDMAVDKDLKLTSIDIIPDKCENVKPLLKSNRKLLQKEDTGNLREAHAVDNAALPDTSKTVPSTVSSYADNISDEEQKVKHL